MENQNIENKKPKSIDAESKKKNSIGREIFEWFMVIVAALLISMIIKAFIFSTYQVNMVSMENTLFEGHNVIVFKMGYQPKRGDIIVFMHEEGRFKSVFKYLPIRNPGEVDYIKRVIGLPGDQIDIRDGYVYRKSAADSDFIKLDEPYTKGLTDPKGMKLPYTIPEGKLFAMGDNRERSMDSREIGPIDIDVVIGKAVLRVWPFSEFGGLYK
jgi:signal peptidase I